MNLEIHMMCEQCCKIKKMMIDAKKPKNKNKKTKKQKKKKNKKTKKQKNKTCGWDICRRRK
jgi:hypothetical protein